VDLNRVELRLDRPVTEKESVNGGPDLLGSVCILATVPAIARDDTGWSRRGWASLGEEPASHGREVELVAIPYHLWANRGPSVMRIFTPTGALAASESKSE